MIAQAPFMTAMYYAIRNLSGSVKEMPFLGLGSLTDNAGASAAGWLLLAVMTLTQIITTKQLSSGQDAQQQRMMIYMMPLFFLFIMVRLPAGLVLYWATSQVYQLVQQVIMLKNNPQPQLVTARPSNSAHKQPFTNGKKRPSGNGKKKNQNAKRRVR